MIKKLPVLLIAALCFNVLQAQTVSTITAGDFSDGLAIDKNGNVYGSDFFGTEVFRYNTAATVVDNFAAGITNPNGIGINDQNEIFICEHAFNGVGSIKNIMCLEIY